MDQDEHIFQLFMQHVEGTNKLLKGVGRNDMKTQLILEVGPAHAESIFNQMFTFYQIGYKDGMRLK